MCGIVGYVGKREATPILVDGLRRLEYRGYDSAGIAVANGQGARLVRCQGKLSALEKLLAVESPHGLVGIGHTRWATHGRPSEQNAHPHKAGAVSVVHNGIIENHTMLRERLTAVGRDFSSQTDTEVLAHLIDQALIEGASSFPEAVRQALRRVEGSYAIAVLSDCHPNEMVAAKQASPLVAGVGKGEMFLASDAQAILDQTREVIFLEDGDVAHLDCDQVASPILTDKPCNVRRRPSPGHQGRRKRRAIRTSCSRRFTSSRAQ